MNLSRGEGKDKDPREVCERSGAQQHLREFLSQKDDDERRWLEHTSEPGLEKVVRSAEDYDDCNNRELFAKVLEMHTEVSKLIHMLH